MSFIKKDKISRRKIKKVQGYVRGTNYYGGGKKLMYILNEETRRKLRELNLNEVIDILDEQAKQAEYLQLSFNERLQMIVDHVYQVKYNNKVKRLINSAKFRISNASTTDIHYVERGLDKKFIDVFYQRFNLSITIWMLFFFMALLDQVKAT